MIWDYTTCMRLLMLSVSSGLVSIVTVQFCLLASIVVHGFRSVLLSVLLYAFSSWLLIRASFGLQMASYESILGFLWSGDFKSLK
jgi:hypothetical protein